MTPFYDKARESSWKERQRIAEEKFGCWPYAPKGYDSPIAIMAVEYMLALAHGDSLGFIGGRIQMGNAWIDGFHAGYRWAREGKK